MNPRWSASRFGSFSSCLTKYKYNYIDELIVLGKTADVTQKGLAFHEIAEQMNSKLTLEELTEIAIKKIDEKDFDKEKYPVIKCIPRFYAWWHEVVVPLEKKEWKINKEEWLYSAIDGKNVVGAIDLLAISPDEKEALIVDFKSGTTAKVAGYENQLQLYAYMIKNKLKTSYDKIKTYLFFPLSGIKDIDKEIGDDVLTKKNMLKSYKQLVFTKNDVDDMLDHFKNIIKESDNMDWDNFDIERNANMGFFCSFCDFCGHPELCPATYKAGLRFPRKCKVMTKAEFKELQNE